MPQDHAVRNPELLLTDEAGNLFLPEALAPAPDRHRRDLPFLRLRIPGEVGRPFRFEVGHP